MNRFILNCRHASQSSFIIMLLVLILANPLAAATKALSKQTYQKLQASQKLLEAGDSNKAITQLETLLVATTERPYEQAITLQTLAHAHLSRDAYDKAIPYLLRSINLNQLPDEAQQRGRRNLAQLYLASKRFNDAIAIINTWLAHAKKPQAEVYAMLGSAYLQLSRYADAVAPLHKAIELKKTPKENWYQSLLGAYNELKNYTQCVAVLHDMIKLFPQRPLYWRQLAGIEIMLEHDSEALAVMELAYLRGHIDTERDLLNLAQLYAQRNAPYKAAKLLEKEIANNRIEANSKHWELAANAWSQARESKRAIKALEHAWKKSPQPALGIRLSQYYIEAQRWQVAGDVLQNLLDRKKMKDDDTGRAWLLLGITRYETKLHDEARTALTEASKYSKTQKDALQWLAALE